MNRVISGGWRSVGVLTLVLLMLTALPGIAGARGRGPQRLERPRRESPAAGRELRERLAQSSRFAPAQSRPGFVTVFGGTYFAGSSLPDSQVIADAFLSTDPFLDCRPFLTGVQVLPAAADGRQFSVRAGYGASSFPTAGSDFLLLSTGDPDLPAEAADVDFGAAGCADDNVQVVFSFTFPDLGGGVSPVNSMKFDFDMFSYEFPEFVDAGFNDYALAYVDAPVPIELDASCNAPLEPSSGCLVTFDGQGNPTNVDNVFFQGCDQIGCDVEGAPGWEAIYGAVPGDDAGRTGTLTTCTPTDCTIPVTPGAHTLTLIVGDAGDGVYTTAGLFDNLRCFSDLQCEEPTTTPDFDPPLCARIFGGESTPEVAQGRATAQEGGAEIVSVEAILLENAELDVDLGESGSETVDFSVSVIDPGQDGQGIVRATDSNGESCDFEVDFHGLPAGPLAGEELCSADGLVFQASNEDTPGGVSSCTITDLGGEEPPLPLGFHPSPEGDPFPCRVFTIDSGVSGGTEMVYKKDGDCDTNLRLLFSRSTDGGLTFPPFADVTESLECITNVIPDPTRLSGTVIWSPVKITCALLDLDCSDPALEGLDQDGDGVPFCSGGVVEDCNDANPAIPVFFEHRKKHCDGLDNDCDGKVDEGCKNDEDEDGDEDGDGHGGGDEGDDED